MRFLLGVALLLPGAAQAAERRYSVTSFERLRVDGPFEVRVSTGASPGARASGDPRLLDGLTVEANGDTLVIHLGHGDWSETSARSSATPPVVTLTTPILRTVTVNAGGRVTVARMAAPRLLLAVNGAGAIGVTDAEADEVVATVVGAGTMTLAGKAARARLLTNGPGTIDAGALVAGELSVRLDGTGETRARARFTAEVTTTGLGKVTVAGPAKCAVRALAGGPVECGAGH